MEIERETMSDSDAEEVTYWWELARGKERPAHMMTDEVERLLIDFPVIINWPRY